MHYDFSPSYAGAQIGLKFPKEIAYKKQIHDFTRRKPVTWKMIVIDSAAESFGN
jgi:hypothetical protein